MDALGERLNARCLDRGMGELKLYGMKAAYDETLATGSNANTSRSALSAIF